MAEKHNRGLRPGWILVFLLFFAALTVSDDRVILTSDLPVKFTWNPELTDRRNQGGPDPVDSEFEQEESPDVPESEDDRTSTTSLEKAPERDGKEQGGPVPGSAAKESDAAGDSNTAGGKGVFAAYFIQAAGTGAAGNIPGRDEPEGNSPEQGALASGISHRGKLPLVVTHTVQPGETLWDIAQRYNIDIDTIVAANEITNPERLTVGEDLKILTVKGALHTVQKGESLWEIARIYRASTQEIIDANHLQNPSSLRVGQELVIPGAQSYAARRYRLVSRSGQLQRAFSWPVRGPISSPFGPRWGRMHEGLDIAVVTGTPVRAAADGRVTWSGYRGSYGKLVIIDHGYGIETRYAHNSRLVVRRGSRVKRGQVIAYSGNTGRSTGPHLHFEIRYRGKPVDPQKYLVH